MGTSVKFKDIFLSCVGRYTQDDQKASALWLELERAYSSRQRHYHTLTHLEHLTNCLIPLKEQFVRWDAVIFAIGYHDVVYNVLKKNNEEKSAVFAEKRMTSLNVSNEDIQLCKSLILATKQHENSLAEINLFTDADLAVLGSGEKEYFEYADRIRKEYSIYPDVLYIPGRKKVIQHFLAMNRIFKSHEFFERYETQARANLITELSRL
jgi:predicted metal-dependent HD superfamily phosphohydrolase